MSSPAQPVQATGAIREAIDPQRFPWIRPLVSEYARRFDRVSAFFNGNPADPAAWRSVIDRVARAPRDRARLHAVLVHQLNRRGAPAEARNAAADLARPTSVAIVTGQQAGLFGGPLYTLLKAVTAIQLARHVRDTYGVEAVPVFWVDAEDHDWNEVRTAQVLDREGALARVTASDPDGAGRSPVGRLAFASDIAGVVARLGELLQPSEFTADVLGVLNRRYVPGSRVGAAFAGLMDDLLGQHGLVVFEADDPAAKPLAADVLLAELERHQTAQLATQAGAELAALGHAPQVDLRPDSTCLFYLDGADRRPIRAGSEFSDEARKHPERLSPNVLLRPIVQDRIFPTACYVAGPSELAYLAQLRGAYEAFGLTLPLIYERASATLLDSGAAKFLDRAELPFEALQSQDDGVLNKLLESRLPAGIEASLDRAETAVRDQLEQMRPLATGVDATLASVVDTTRDRVHETLKTLRAKIVQASKRKDDTIRRQFTRTRALAFPGGVPQERALSMVFFANRYGLSIGRRLLDTLPLSTDRHLVISF